MPPPVGTATVLALPLFVALALVGADEVRRAVAEAPPAVALPECAGGALLPNLLRRSDHRLEGFGRAEDGSVALLYVHRDSGRWVLLRADPRGGFACVVAHGEGWTGPPPGAETRTGEGGLS